MVDSIKSILIKRDGLSEEEAEEKVDECRDDFHNRLAEGDMPYDICEEYFGLEPDYLEELI